MLSRKEFLTGVGLTLGSIAAAPGPSAFASVNQAQAKCARAITMWDFSWLERRWPGAGYEDWD